MKYRVLKNDYFVEEGIILKDKKSLGKISGIDFYSFVTDEEKECELYLPLECVEEIKWNYTKY